MRRETGFHEANEGDERSRISTDLEEPLGLYTTGDTASSNASNCLIDTPKNLINLAWSVLIGILASRGVEIVAVIGLSLVNGNHSDLGFNFHAGHVLEKAHARSL